MWNLKNQWNQSILNKNLGERGFVKLVGISVFSFLFLLCVILSLWNYWIDPFFLYGVSSHRYNHYFKPFDERVEKVNRIYYGKESYDSVLLGSSRATYVNQYDFQEQKLFNFSASSMRPFEYQYYLELMKQKGHSLKTIYLQIDFFGSNEIFDEKTQYTTTKLEKVVFEPLKNPLHRFSQLFQWNKQLIEIPRFQEKVKTYDNGWGYYSRDNVKYNQISEEKKINRFKENLKRHTLDFIGDKYCFNENLKEILSNIKANHPHSQFVIYTSPVSAALFASEINFAKRWEEYKQWIRIHLEVFDSLYQFGGFNAITQNLQNYPDDDHFYPSVGTIIAKTLTQKDFMPIQDFGIYLTLENVEEYFTQLEKSLKEYDMSEIIEIMNDETIEIK